MYNWRKMSKEQQDEVLQQRQIMRRPWHSPPHKEGKTKQYILTSSCYEHKTIIGLSATRMAFFENELIKLVESESSSIYGWVILPNHYHILLKCDDIFKLLKQFHQLHGKTSFQWNKAENKQGRKVWCNTLERAIKNERHFYTTLNYIHHNPVKHRYVKKWTDWVYSSAAFYLKQKGKEQVLREWNEYNIDKMGNCWDEF